MSKSKTVGWKQARSRRPVDETEVRREMRRLRDHHRAYRLREMREAQGVTQQQLAERLCVTQPTVSALESGDLERSGIATLRSYIEALGGTVEVSARFGKERMVLLGGDD